jgi:hypothetical protein
MTAPPILWTSLETAVITGGRNSCDWQATGVCLNAAEVQPGDLFFAGDNDDLREVFLKGAAAAVVAHNVPETGGWPLLKVADVFEALRGMARAARFKTHAQVVAVQGQEARHAVMEILSAACDVYKGRRHLSLGLAGLPESSDFAVFGFSPMVRPDIAVVTDCKNADGSVFETMAPNARILISADTKNFMDAIAMARASGIRNIFTYGRAKDADAVLLECLNANNGVRVRMRVLGENLEAVLPAGEGPAPEMLAGALILKLSEVSGPRIAQILSKESPRAAGETSNVSLMDKLLGGPSQTAFRVMNVIDRGYGRRMAVLDNVFAAPQRTSIFSNKELDIPMKIDNLELVYACKEVSLFSNAEAAIQQARPAAALGNIVPSVLGPGDFLTFKGLLGGSKNLMSSAMRLMPQVAGKKIQ